MGPVIGGVAAVGVLGTVGYLFWAKKACFAPKNVPSGNVATNVPTTNANMQGAQA